LAFVGVEEITPDARTHAGETERRRIDLRINLDSAGRIWVSAPDASAPEEAWLQDADDTPLPLRASGLCPLEEKYTSGTWTSATLDPQEIAGQLWVEASYET
jgi:hypothetical protein